MATSATLIKTVTLRLGEDQYECQLSAAEVTDEPSVETFTSFCGEQDFPTANYKLHLAGAQDWVDVDGICRIIHAAYITDPIASIEFEVKVGEDNPTAVPPKVAAYRSGLCKPSQDVSFGGQAGSPLTFDLTLDIDGVPDEEALT